MGLVKIAAVCALAALCVFALRRLVEAVMRCDINRRLDDLEATVERLEATSNFATDVEAQRQASETRAFIEDARRRWS